MNTLQPNNTIAHCAFSLGCGGAERILVTTVRQLYKEGFHDQHVVLANFSHPDDLYYRQEISQVAHIHFAELSDVLPHSTPAIIKYLPRRIKKNIIAIYSSLKKINADTVHIWSDNVYAALAAQLLPVRRILIVWHNIPPITWHKIGVLSSATLPKTWLHYILFRHVITDPRVRLACVTRTGADQYARWFGIPAKCISTLHHGMDTTYWKKFSPDAVAEERKRLGIAEQARLVVGLMRFSDQKRPQLWIDAAARVRERLGSSVEFICYGDGPLRAGLLPYATACGVRCPGVTQNVPLALSMADIFFHSARFEGLPTVHVEAQLMGCPIVSTAGEGGTREAVHDGITARLVPEQPDMVSALSDTLIAALHDKDFLAQASQEGPRFVKENFSIEQMIQTTLELYR